MADNAAEFRPYATTNIATECGEYDAKRTVCFHEENCDRWNAGDHSSIAGRDQRLESVLFELLECGAFGEERTSVAIGILC